MLFVTVNSITKTKAEKNIISFYTQ